MIITLCGSNRFERHFKGWNKALTLSGHVVFSLSAYASDERDLTWYTTEEKKILDKVHKEKIYHSDAILLLNVFAYAGDSTLSEVKYAEKNCKRLYALESWGKGKGVLKGSHLKEVVEKKVSYLIPQDYVSPIDTTYFGSPYELLSINNRGKLLEIVKI